MKPFFCAMLFLLLYGSAWAIGGNPILSRGKTVYTSSGNKTYLTDDVFGGGNAFSVYNNCWFAINVGSGPSKLFFNWNNPGYSWSDVIAGAGSCKNSLTFPQDYTIQTSSNSTNGSDGSWTTVVTVTNNNVTARGHAVSFSGKSWVRMYITRGGGSIDELEVFDQSSSSEDSWFFPGTSITANTYKGTPPSQTYADLIKQRTGYSPVMVRGGIPCITSTNFANDVYQYLNNANNVKYWAIEMGTNDAWGGSNYNANTFKNNIQTVINACKNAGITPVIARMIGTNASAAGWQVHPDFLKAIDDLTSANGLPAGPDLYNYFISHTSELNSDGVHPNATGAASIQRLWADKMQYLYTSSGGGGTVSEGTYKITFRSSGLALDVYGASTADGGDVVQWGYNGGRNQQWFVRNAGNGQYSIVNANSGKVLDVTNNATYDGADINQWASYNTNNQKWLIQSVGGGYYKIVNVNSSKCIDMYNNSTTEGTPIQQWGCNGGNNQSFTFTKLSSATYRSTTAISNSTTGNAAIVQVYPNPSSKMFTINKAGAYSYVITNASGAVMERGKTNGKATVGEKLLPGAYTLTILSGSETKTIKLIKN